MRRHLLNVLSAGIVAAAFVFVPTLLFAQNAPPDMTDYGYSHVLGSLVLQPGEKGTITVPDQYSTSGIMGYETITIPANAFKVPVRFEVLGGKNSVWNKQVDANLQVVANFAFLVTNLNTGDRIAKFNAPVTYSVTDSMINSNSIYWATTAANPPKLINANGGSTISGDTLKHGAPVAVVGWIITSPKNTAMSSSGSMSSSNSSSSSSGGY